MSYSTQQLWTIPVDPDDMAPLPVLRQGESYFVYNRKAKCFDAIGADFVILFDAGYETFDECRAAMMEARTEALKQVRTHARDLAASIEHIRTIPTAAFPDVVRKVSEAQQQEAQGEEKAQAEEMSDRSNPPLKRPTRKTQ